MQAHPTPSAVRRPSNGRALPWLLALTLVIGAGGAWWWHAHTTPTAQAAAAAGGGGSGGARRFAGANPAQPVSVEGVRRRDVRVTVNAIGSLMASNTALVRAQVSGVLQQLKFQEGQQVQAGAVLAQIDPRAFQAAVSQAEGVLARDTAQLQGAKVDLARYRDLLAKDALPKQQLDTQMALVAQLEGTVKADQGAVDNARLSLSYSRVTAPISGRVGLKQVDIGNVTGPNDANGIVSIAQTRPIALVFSVPAAHLPTLNQRLQARAPLPVQAWARGGTQAVAQGAVAAIDNAIDASTDAVKVKAVFPNSDGALYPNQAVNVTLQLDTLADALVVPQAAVLRGAQGFYVYLVKSDGTVTVRTVKPGPVDAGGMAVEADLQPGDRVVIDGTDRLREGARVEVIAANPAERAGAGASAAGARRGGHSHAAAHAASAAEPR